MVWKASNGTARGLREKFPYVCGLGSLHMHAYCLLGNDDEVCNVRAAIANQQDHGRMTKARRT